MNLFHPVSQHSEYALKLQPLAAEDVNEDRPRTGYAILTNPWLVNPEAYMNWTNLDVGEARISTWRISSTTPAIGDDGTGVWRSDISVVFTLEECLLAWQPAVCGTHEISAWKVDPL